MLLFNTTNPMEQIGVHPALLIFRLPLAPMRLCVNTLILVLLLVLAQ